VDRDRLQLLLQQVSSGETSVESALTDLSRLPSADLDIASIDTHRQLRRGFCESILAEFKTPEDTARIAEKMAEHHSRFLITRACPETFAKVSKVCSNARYLERSRLIQVGTPPEISAKTNFALVACAGTSDLAVAEEALETARFLGQRTEMITDVGVAGLHRLLKHQDRLRQAAVIVVVAGMEGALASVVSGLVACPVVAVPTSIGYGAYFGGVSALLSMINSCSPGVCVVNIDNGFGAGYLAAQICQGQRSATET
jgi:pyridinium-3,5-biscarboxylic acid mononucleotide synthase